MLVGGVVFHRQQAQPGQPLLGAGRHRHGRPMVAQAGFGHHVEHHGGRDGLDQYAVEHGFQLGLALGQQFAVVGGDHDDQRRFTCRQQTADLPARFPAVQRRHAPVDEHHVVGTLRVAPGHGGQRVVAVVGHLHLPAERERDFTQDLARAGIVVHHQAGQPTQVRQARPLRGDRFGRFGRRLQLDHEAELAALARGAVHFQGAAHQARQALADGQAQAGAAVAARRRRLGLGKTVEDVAAMFGRDADAGVAHGERDRQAALAAPGQPGRQHHLARGREFDGVAGQVEQDLLQAQGVAHQPRGQGRVDAEQHFHVLVAHVGRQDHGQVAPQLVQTERVGIERQLARLHLGKVENVVEQAQQRAGRRLGLGGVVVLAPVQGRLLQQLQHAQHGVHGRADLVAHVGQEFRLGPARLQRLLLGQQQGVVGGARFRDVGAAADPAQHLAVAVALRQRVVVEQAPLAIAVAQPAVAAEFAPVRLGQLPGRLQRRAVVRVDDGRPMLARQQLRRRHARVVVPVVAEEVQPQGWGGGPHHLRQAFRQRAPARLGGRQPGERALQGCILFHQLRQRTVLGAHRHPHAGQEGPGQQVHHGEEEGGVADFLVPRGEEVVARQPHQHIDRIVADALQAEHAVLAVEPALGAVGGVRLAGRQHRFRLCRQPDRAADHDGRRFRVAVQDAALAVEQGDDAVRPSVERGEQLGDARGVHVDVGGAAEAAVGLGERVHQRQHPLVADARLDGHADDQLAVGAGALEEFADVQVLRVGQVDFLAVDHQAVRVRAAHRVGVGRALLERAQVGAEGGVVEVAAGLHGAIFLGRAPHRQFHFLEVRQQEVFQRDRQVARRFLGRRVVTQPALVEGVDDEDGQDQQHGSHRRHQPGKQLAQLDQGFEVGRGRGTGWHGTGSLLRAGERIAGPAWPAGSIPYHLGRAL